ncbi:sodium:calcium antiporter [Pseudonocardia alaniniphila]|uniref:Sodium:proton exchanger n=1 Tax=Pseudonocardia alaniniphila TaxID=75291 RepID=A0ABS9T8L5_9PSEU|nr:sodium:proton exchanger [Pseudonocardia alaniniphila]MCH6164881.1 sodium:proton exchanger [Pseudonocardia alaniniphila]
MTSILIFAAGAALLIYSAEKLITYLVGAARGLAISLFLLAILFTGIEFDDLAFGVVLNLEGLEDVALGVVFGTVISMTGLVLAIAALVAPSRVEIPKDYIALFAIAPLILIWPALLGGLGTATAIVLILLFVVFVAYIAYRERQRAVPTFRSAEVIEAAPSRELVGAAAGKTGGGGGTGGHGAGDLYETGQVGEAKANKRPGWLLLLLALLALIGLVVGAWAMTEGTEGILENFAISGTVFGATIATLVLSLEDIFLTAEPARRGAPAIGVGNVIGSVVFSVTAKVGIIALAGGALVITSDIFTWHLPALVAINGFAAYALFTGHLRRWHGVVLLAGYIAYWVVSFSVFGLVPVDDAPGADDDAQQAGIEAPAVPGAPDDDAPAPAIPVAPPADNDG